MFNRLILVTLAIITIFSSCTIEDSADVNQAKIYADYDLRYDANTDKTRVVATFKFGGATGTNLQLSDPAQVVFNGEKLPFKPIYGGHTKEFAGQVMSGTFEYTNTEGDVVVNTTPSIESIAFPDQFDSISKSSSIELNWVGSPLSENQRTAIFIGSWTWGQDALFLENGEGANFIVLDKGGLNNLPLGNSTVFMERSTARDIEEGTDEGGRIRASYRAENKSIIIVE